MIRINELDRHHSSPSTDYADFEALAKRYDLYTGEDFYFGFASSNRSFLDIIGAHQHLAIKHGPILSIYRQDGALSYSCETAFIDPLRRELLPFMRLRAEASEPTSSKAFRQLLPWTFSDSYVDSFVPSISVDEKLSGTPESSVSKLLEQLANNVWPNDHDISRFPLDIAAILESTKGLSIDLVDLMTLKTRLMRPVMPATADNFMTPYDPFDDNVRVSIDELVIKNPTRITVRQVVGDFPRVEIIIPGMSLSEKQVFFVSKSEQNDLYHQFFESLTDSIAVQDLLMRHYPDQLSNYRIKHGFGLLSAAPSAKP